MSEAYIIDAVRTPRGKRGGSFAHTHPVNLAVTALNALPERTGLDPAEIDDVVMGCVTQTGEQGLDIGRASVLAAGWPIQVAGVALNRFCGSGQQAVNFAAQGIMSGMQDVVVGAGVENMTRVPMGSDFGPMSDLMTANYPDLVPQGVSAEMIVDKWGYTREQVDGFALESQKRAARAWEEGRFAKSILPTPAKNEDGSEFTVTKDEHFRPGTTTEALAGLKTIFKPDGVITAGNSSGIVDGAAAVLLASGEAVERLGLKPRAKIRAMAVVGSEPKIMLTGPIPAVAKVLKKSGMSINDIDLIEINEAFAPVPLCVMQECDMDHDKVNVNGGAIALGHPLGATGSMLVGTLLDELERTDQTTGLVTMCIGFGMGIATVIERV